MIAYVAVNRDRTTPSPWKTPLPGVTYAHMTKSGITVFFFDDQFTARAVGDWPLEPAAPGMVGIDMNCRSLWIIDADGEAHALPLQVKRIEHELHEVVPPDEVLKRYPLLGDPQAEEEHVD